MAVSGETAAGLVFRFRRCYCLTRQALRLDKFRGFVLSCVGQPHFSGFGFGTKWPTTFPTTHLLQARSERPPVQLLAVGRIQTHLRFRVPPGWSGTLLR